MDYLRSIRRYVGCAWVLIIVCAVPTLAKLPGDPNNAALLYYRACLIHPDVSDLALSEVLHGATPNEEVRTHLGRPAWRNTIELVQIATQMPDCDWGMLYSRGRDLEGDVLGHLPILGRLLSVCARVMAADEDWRGALDMCLTMRRYATQIGDSTYILYAMSQRLNMEALLAVEHVLGLMPPDEPMLIWLKERLGRTTGTEWAPAEAMKRFGEMELQGWRVEPQRLAWQITHESLLQAVMNESTRNDVLSEASRAYARFLDSALAIIEADRSYSEKVDALEDLVSDAEQRIAEGNPIALLWAPVKWAIPYYNLHVAGRASFNATMTGIELYIARAHTGELPKTLPSGLPGDSFSGKAFEYEITEEGFTLRGHTAPVGTRQVREYVFKIGNSEDRKDK